MQDREPALSQGSRERRFLWTVGLAAVAAFGLVRFTTPARTDRQVQTAQAPVADRIASGPVSAPMSAGARVNNENSKTRPGHVCHHHSDWPYHLSNSYGRRCKKSVRRRWVAIAQRFPSRSHAAQKQMHARMAEWSKLSSMQRAEARFRYLQAAKLDARWKRERWRLTRREEAEHREGVAATQVKVIPPVSVNAGTGATGDTACPQLVGRANETIPVDVASPLGEHIC